MAQKSKRCYLLVGERVRLKRFTLSCDDWQSLFGLLRSQIGRFLKALWPQRFEMSKEQNEKEFHPNAVVSIATVESLKVLTFLSSSWGVPAQ